MHKIAIAAGLAVTLMGAAAPAWAGDISCAWDNLPSAVRQEFDRLARSSEPGKALDLIDDPSWIGAIDACRFPSPNGPRLLRAVNGLLIQKMAELNFSGLFTPEQLNAAWDRIDRAVVATGVAKRAGGDYPEIGNAEAELLARELNVAADDTRTRALTLVYAAGRITRASGEEGF